MTRKQLITSLMAGVFALQMTSGCTTLSRHPDSAGQGAEQTVEHDTADSEKPLVQLKEIDSFRVTDPEGPKVVAEELEEIPVEINSLVEKWVDYFQGRGRPHMERYLSRSTRYMKLMKKILRQNGLPEDLVYIALIESGFSFKATSRAAAVGYWQFIRGTGRRYGLEISSMVDERRDPILSTQAAAEYFKGLYSVFGSWYLAMASYNVGENRVKREVMAHFTRDFWELARKKRFPKETINYIPKFIAAKLIGNNPQKYGFTDIDYMDPIEFEHIVVNKPVNLKKMAESMGMDYDDLKMLNPKYKGEIAPLKTASLELRIPLGKTEVGLAAAEKAAVEKVEYIADAGEMDVYRVKSGDSLSVIARKYRTTVAWLRDANDLKNGRKLRIGQRLFVPDQGSRPVAQKAIARTIVKSQPVREDNEKAASAPEIVTAKGVFYIVQPGDTLSAIADDYNSSVDELRRMNKLNRGSVLKAGLKLRVPKDDGLPTEVAQSDRRSPAQVLGQTLAPGMAHVVRAGENLTTIAKKYGVSVSAIQKTNQLSRRSVLKVGAKILIPGKPQSQKAKKSSGRYQARHLVKKNATQAQGSMGRLNMGARLLVPEAKASK